MNFRHCYYLEGLPEKIRTALITPAVEIKYPAH
jgi:hypothetical protein